jgi:hypothetical protein
VPVRARAHQKHGFRAAPSLQRGTDARCVWGLAQRTGISQPRRRIVRRMAFLIPCTLLLLASATPTQAPDGGNRMSVVAALRATSSPESLVAIRAGLKSSDTRVRAAAARIASVSDPSRFIADLSSALATETDAEAAREEAWALAIGDPTGFLEPILKAAERDGIRDVVLEALGAAKGARMSEIWPALPKSLIATGAPALVRGARRTGNLAVIAPLVLRDHMVEGWREALSGHTSLDQIAPGLMLAALTSPSAQIRTDAYVALLGATATLVADRELLPPADRQERIARRLFEATRGLPTEIQLDREISQATDEDSPLAAEIRNRASENSEAGGRVRGGLSQAEASALAAWLQGWIGGDIGMSETVKVTSEAINASTKAWGRSKTTIGTVKGFPSGFADAVLREWGCRGEDRSIAANVVFEADGRPSQIQMVQKPGEKGCGAAAQVLFGAALGSLPKGGAVLVLPAYRRSVDCIAATSANEWEPGRFPVSRTAAFAKDSKEPVKKTNDYPEYSGARLDRQVWGEVDLRAVLARTGCLVSIEGYRATEGIQDLRVIEAMSRWTYSPLLFRGTAMPVRFGVKVSFILN